jgi:ubiquinone/menaquinone biosynthesis C-methylase UbiE
MTIKSGDRSVSDHYGRSDLGRAVLAALRAAGKNPDALTVEDLAPVDQLHVRGKETTLGLARLAGLTPAMKVLDVGGGIGGPARTLASEFGCALTVLDLTEEFCRVGEMLTARTRLSDRVTFQLGNALDLPFRDNSFDVVWVQHGSMNIAAKERLFAEIYRVLHSGGRLALHEIMAGPVTPIHFPVPWARNPLISHLLPPETVRMLIRGMGFKEIAWVDMNTSAVAGVKERLAAIQATPGVQPSLGQHVLFGPDFAQMLQNHMRNVEEDRTIVIQGVFGRL